MQHVSELIVSLVDRVTAPARRVQGAMDRLQKVNERNIREMNKMRGQMLDAAAGAYALARAVSAPIQSAMEFESAMADVRKVVDFETPDAFAQMGEDIIALSKQLPMTASQIAMIAASAGQAGMAGDELLKFSEMAAKVGVAFDMSAEQSGDALAKIKTALQLSVEETQLLADSFNHLSNSMASEAPDIIDFMNRVGSQGKQFGFTAEQTAALGSAMIAAGSESNVAATSFRNVGKALTKGAAATTAQKKAYKALGLDAKKVAKQMQVDAVTTLKAVLVQVRQLPREMQASTLSQLFGDEARALAPLIENVQLLDQALAAVAEQQNYAGSVGEEYAVRVDTAANKLQLFSNKLQATSIAIGQALMPALNATLDVLGPIVELISQFATENPELVQTIVAVVGALVALRLATLAARFATLFLNTAMLDVVIGVGRFGLALLGLLNPMNIVRAGLFAMRVAIISTGIGAIAVAIAMAGLWIYNNWSGLVAFFKSFGNTLSEAFGPAMPLIQPLVDAAVWLAEVFANLTGEVDASEAEWASWGESAGNAVVGFVQNVQNMVEAVGQWFNDVIAAANDLGTAISDFVINFQIPTFPEILDWLMRIAAEGIFAAFEIAWPNLPDWLQQLLTLADGILSFGLNIDWPEIPESIKWLASQAGGGISAAGNKIGEGVDNMKQGAANAWNGIGDAWNGLMGGADGARAAGGAVAGGKSYRVNEFGQEIFTAPSDGFIINASDTQRLLNKESGETVAIHIGQIVIKESANARQVADELGEELRSKLSGLFADQEWSAS
jgi:TP901 family phage tail tape measure protein